MTELPLEVLVCLIKEVKNGYLKENPPLLLQYIWPSWLKQLLCEMCQYSQLSHLLSLCNKERADQ